MASQSDAAAPGMVRESISFRRLPWIRPLVEAAAHDHQSVASFFHGDPASRDAWRATIARVQRQPRDRNALASLLVAQLTRRGAPQPAIDAAATLASDTAVAVVTGQQAGVFGGPLYTLLKAVSAIQLARAAEAAHGVPVVPVFWVDADDHDWNEIRSVHVLDREFSVATLTAGDVEGAGRRPVGSLSFDDSITRLVDDVTARLAPTEFTADLVATLQRHYRPGANPAEACAGWLDTLLGAEGLVVFEASDPAAKRIAAPVFQREVTHPCATARLARERGDLMTAAGHNAQIVPGDDVVCLFRIDQEGRTPVRAKGNGFVIGSAEVTADALAAEIAAHPERFSPNVLLRPLVQDTIFPTACYVAGPSELAYHAQLGDAYAAFGIEPPLVASRASATLIDSAAARFLDRTGMALEELQTQDESALNRLLERQFPVEIDAAFAEIEKQITDSTTRLNAAATQVDATLAGAVETTATRMRDTLKTLQNKIVQASKKKDETVRRQFIRTRALTFPDGHPQERLLNVTFFVNRYGFDLGARLIELLPMEADHHYVVVP